MTINYTTLLGLALPVTGTESGTWGDDVSNGITQYIDASVAGTQSITTDADVTLSLTNGSSAGTNLGSTSSQYMQLLCTGARTALRYINVPNSSKMYVVNNSTTGGYSITVRGVTGPTTGVTVINGEKAIIYWNSVSSDFVKISSNTITSFTGVLSPVNGGTGVANNAASTITISGSFGTTLTVTGTTAVTLPTSGTLLSTAAAVTPAQGGTGVANNAASTITISGNYASTFVVSGAYSYTLPAATDTLVNLGSSQTLTSKTLTNPTITAYLETAPSIANSSTAVTLSLSSGTVLSYTLTGNCTFTMPTATSGTSFIVKLVQDGTGSRTATFTGVKWPAGTAPTITTTATTGLDILSFVCINSVWYGTYAQAFA
jgi:hypothetical protein